MKETEEKIKEIEQMISQLTEEIKELTEKTEKAKNQLTVCEQLLLHHKKGLNLYKELENL